MRVCLTTRTCAGGSLFSVLQEFGALHEDVIANYARQVLTGLNYLHERNIAHRDIKGACVCLLMVLLVQQSHNWWRNRFHR